MKGLPSSGMRDKSQCQELVVRKTLSAASRVSSPYGIASCFQQLQAIRMNPRLSCVLQGTHPLLTGIALYQVQQTAEPQSRGQAASGEDAAAAALHQQPAGSQTADAPAAHLVRGQSIQPCVLSCLHSSCTWCKLRCLFLSNPLMCLCKERSARDTDCSSE